jgi:hypothetical protein
MWRLNRGRWRDLGEAVDDKVANTGPGHSRNPALSLVPMLVPLELIILPSAARV